MTYEEEQIKYAEELKKLTKELTWLDEIFGEPEKVNIKLNALYKQLNDKNYHFQYMSPYEEQQREYRFRQMLENDYRGKKGRKIELERLLSQTPAERTKENIKNGIGKTAGYLASITPQHVSGRVYKVENGDGCGTFCLWFMIIDAIIVLIYFLVTGGK